MKMPNKPVESASEPVELPLRQLLNSGATIPIFVESESMSPLLKTGDKLSLQTASVDDLCVGDIITLEQSDHLLTHRFYGIKNGLLQTRGDRNLAMDGLQSPDCLLGKMVGRGRNGRFVSLSFGWCHRHASWLAQTEWRLMAHGQERIQPTIWARIVHRLVYMWEWLLFVWV